MMANILQDLLERPQDLPDAWLSHNNNPIERALFGGNNDRSFSFDVNGTSYPVKVIDSRGKVEFDGRRIEFYSPDEERSPYPGTATIEILDSNLRGEDLDNAIRGEIIHYLPSIDPEFERLRQKFKRSMTPEQVGMDKRAFEKRDIGDNRSYDDWHNIHRLDQWLGGYLAPVGGGWEGYTKEQINILEQMRFRLPKN